MSLKARILDDLKTAMKAGDTGRRDTLRLITSELKRFEIDHRDTPLDDARILELLDKMAKMRRESITQFEAAGRADLVGKEQAELAVIADYLPAPMGEAEIDAEIAAAIAETGAQSIRDMGKVMAVLKPRLYLRADPQRVGPRVKARLG